MVHIAIMNKRVGLIDKILSRDKRIESRFLKTKSIPYGKVQKGDAIYFKDSGGKVRASAIAEKVIEYTDLNLKKVGEIVHEYGGEGYIYLVDTDYETWAKEKKYAILIFLKDVKPISPFSINKSGFGTGAAWLTVEDINQLTSSWSGNDHDRIS